METCERNRVAIMLYLDDELALDERIALESHLCLCQSCQQAVADERTLLKELRSDAPTHYAPKRLRARVEEIVRKALPPLIASVVIVALGYAFRILYT